MDKRLVAVLLFAFSVAALASFTLYRLVFDTQPVLAPARETRLAPKGAGGGFGATIPQGMRAVAVPVDGVIGVAGFAIPGMHVDVFISGTPPSGTGSLEIYTRALLRNIEVLSTGRDFKRDAEGKPMAVQVVNLLVTPEQADQLSLASHEATIQLVLRNPLDRPVPKTPGVVPSFPADVPPPAVPFSGFRPREGSIILLL